MGGVRAPGEDAQKLQGTSMDTWDGEEAGVQYGVTTGKPQNKAELQVPALAKSPLFSPNSSLMLKIQGHRKRLTLARRKKRVLYSSRRQPMAHSECGQVQTHWLELPIGEMVAGLCVGMDKLKDAVLF